MPVFILVFYFILSDYLGAFTVMTVLLIFDQIKIFFFFIILSSESEFESLSLCQFPEPSQITVPLSICAET